MTTKKVSFHHPNATFLKVIRKKIMEQLKSKLLIRINENFDELNEKTNFKSNYWKEIGFYHDSNEILVDICVLEEYFRDISTNFSDDELLDLLEFLIIQNELHNQNGYE